MRPEEYIPQFEEETKGARKLERTFTFANLFITFLTVGLLVTASISITSKTDISKNNLKTATNPNLNFQVKSGAILIPSMFPTNIPQLEEYDDDDVEESIRRKSKYPTHHPKRQKPTAGGTLAPIFVVTDDFLVTPIVVVNTDINPDNTLSPTRENTIIASLQNTM